MKRYYAYIDDQVHGPFATDELRPVLSLELQVCAEGEEAWQRAGDIIELAALLVVPETLPAPEPREGPPDDLPPLLRHFWLVCRNASEQLLAEQKSKHWKKYFKNEQAIIFSELERRGH